MPRDALLPSPLPPCLVLTGTPESGKTLLARRWHHYWRGQASQSTSHRLLIDCTPQGQWHQHCLATRLPAVTPAEKHPMTREAFECWLGEQFHSVSEQEDWLFLPRTVGTDALLDATGQETGATWQSLIQYALPRLMRQLGSLCILDDPPVWLMACLPPEQTQILLTVRLDQLADGWQLPSLPWTEHPPALIVNNYKPDGLPEVPPMDVSDHLASRQRAGERLLYLGRLPWQSDPVPDAEDRWLTALASRLPLACH